MSFLQTQDLTRRFGGLTAVDRVDFRLEPGEIRAVIGPNGAGKTTLVSMICGRVPASDGAIRFGDEDITRLPPWQRVARGIVYTFQITSVFRNLSCFENVALAAQRALTLGKAPWHAVDQATLTASVANALERVELHERHDTPAANLPSWLLDFLNWLLAMREALIQNVLNPAPDLIVPLLAFSPAQVLIELAGILVSGLAFQFSGSGNGSQRRIK